LRFGLGEPAFLPFSPLAGRWSASEKLAMDLILYALSAVNLRKRAPSAAVLAPA
jgi:hypothetical protein